MRRIQSALWLFFISVVFIPVGSFADEIHIAVSSNFASVMKVISHQFQVQSDHVVILSFGSTGKHYAQIKNGAPFDAFFAADSERPKKLIAEGRAVEGSRFTYAIGKLVLWSPDSMRIDQTGNILKQGDYRFLAIANPKLAPYGQAAREVLIKLGIWNQIQDRIVRGENINQSFHYVKSGNAELGFVAYSHIKKGDGKNHGSAWMPPQSLYPKICQQAVVLKKKPAVLQFIRFCRSTAARKIILEYGYEVPDVE